MGSFEFTHYFSSVFQRNIFFKVSKTLSFLSKLNFHFEKEFFQISLIRLTYPLSLSSFLAEFLSFFGNLPFHLLIRRFFEETRFSFSKKDLFPLSSRVLTAEL